MRRDATPTEDTYHLLFIRKCAQSKGWRKETQAKDVSVGTVTTLAVYDHGDILHAE